MRTMLLLLVGMVATSPAAGDDYVIDVTGGDCAVLGGVWDGTVTCTLSTFGGGIGPEDTLQIEAPAVVAVRTMYSLDGEVTIRGQVVVHGHGGHLINLGTIVVVNRLRNQPTGHSQSIIENHGSIRVESTGVFESMSTLYNEPSGEIESHGPLTTGRSTNHGVVRSFATLIQINTLQNFGEIESAGLFTNYGLMINSALITNTDTLTNNGDIDNTAGRIVNGCLATIDGFGNLWGNPPEWDVDSDGDQTCDQFDCDSGDASVWLLPGPVTDLRLNHQDEQTTLQWELQLPGAASWVHDVFQAPSPDFPGVSECLENDTVDGESVHAFNPLPEELICFLVRGQNDCGHGSVGSDSDGDQRQVNGCP